MLAKVESLLTWLHIKRSQVSNMVRCDVCNRVYRGGKGWRIPRRGLSAYGTCPTHMKKSKESGE